MLTSGIHELSQRRVVNCRPSRKSCGIRTDLCIHENSESCLKSPCDEIHEPMPAVRVCCVYNIFLEMYSRLHGSREM